MLCWNKFKVYSGNEGEGPPDRAVTLRGKPTEQKNNCQDRSEHKSEKKNTSLHLGPKIFLLSVSHFSSLHIQYNSAIRWCKENFEIFCWNNLLAYSSIYFFHFYLAPFDPRDKGIVEVQNEHFLSRKQHRPLALPSP